MYSHAAVFRSFNRRAMAANLCSFPGPALAAWHAPHAHPAAHAELASTTWAAGQAGGWQHRHLHVAACALDAGDEAGKAGSARAGSQMERSDSDQLYQDMIPSLRERDRAKFASSLTHAMRLFGGLPGGIQNKRFYRDLICSLLTPVSEGLASIHIGVPSRVGMSDIEIRFLYPKEVWVLQVGVAKERSKVPGVVRKQLAKAQVLGLKFSRGTAHFAALVLCDQSSGSASEHSAADSKFCTFVWENPPADA